jgi:DNA-binding XRE family transcriptional regulator
MKLSDWFYDQKKLNNSYSKQKMSDTLGITRTYLIRIMKGQHTPSYYLAHKIESLTNGNVKALDLLGLKIHTPERRGRPRKVKNDI